MNSQILKSNPELLQKWIANLELQLEQLKQDQMVNMVKQTESALKSAKRQLKNLTTIK